MGQSTAMSRRVTMLLRSVGKGLSVSAVSQVVPASPHEADIEVEIKMLVAKVKVKFLCGSRNWCDLVMDKRAADLELATLAASARGPIQENEGKLIAL